MPCAAPVMMATRSLSRMGGRPNTHAREASTRAAFLATRLALDLVLELFDRDGPEAGERRVNERDRPVDRNLPGVVRMVVGQGRRPVLIGRVDGRIERSKAI